MLVHWDAFKLSGILLLAYCNCAIASLTDRYPKKHVFPNLIKQKQLFQDTKHARICSDNNKKNIVIAKVNKTKLHYLWKKIEIRGKL